MLYVQLETNWVISRPVLWLVLKGIMSQHTVSDVQ